MADEAGRLRRVRALFDRVLDQPPEARPGFLAADPGWSDDERREVAALLAQPEGTGARVPEPPGRVDGGDLVGTRLGPYDVVRLVGLGGMGAVYEAMRADDQYRQRVAIKLVQGGLRSDLTLARFRRERQILARLQHRNIATLFDGGVSPDGRPFLVMEFVEGEPITAWCDRRHLGVRARVELFRQVCGAVQHAHGNLVIHRDLKPGNILVTGAGDVKLLDFGVAKLLGDDGADDALPLTRGGVRAYTPEYASPEQVRGDALTTATDVWSLGIVLFELLAGRRPHAVPGGSVAALERAVLKQVPPRPGSVVTDAAARARGERDAARLARALSPELDSIVLRALRAEPAERWRSVEALADDLKRWLAGAPVEAQRGWAGYRAAKFVRRHRVPLAFATLALVALVGGVIASSVEARRARLAQARAERVSGFLGTVLSSVRSETGGRDVPVSELLDGAAKRIAVELADAPEVRASLEDVIGQSYLALARYEDAERHLRASLALKERTEGRRSAAVVLELNNLGFSYLNRGELGTADSLLHVALALQHARTSRPDTVDAVVLDNLGTIAHDSGRMADAERYHRGALEIRERMLDPHDDRLATALNNVAVALGEQGRWAAAESLERRALAIARANHPEPSRSVADTENALATALDLQGRGDEAEPYYRDALRLRGLLLGRDHPEYAFTLMNFGMFVFDRGEFAVAESCSREVLALRGRTVPEGHPSVAMALQTLGRCLDHDGRPDEAARALEESLALRRKFLGDDHWAVASSEGVLADHFAALRQFPRAVELARSADARFVRALGAGNPRRQRNLERLAGIYDAWGHLAEARAVRARLAAAAR